MQIKIKKYAACLAMSLASVFGVHAQDLLPAETSADRAPAPVAAALSIAEASAVVAENTAAVGYNASFGESVVKTALEYLGARYSYGSGGPYAFDCSGFTSFVYRKQNVPILRDSRSQFTQGTPIARIADLKKGDLVFFGGRSARGGVGHVGIVTEVDPSGQSFNFVHAATGGGVKISNSSENYYSRRYKGARRIVEN